jgi:hypothetical protein
VIAGNKGYLAIYYVQVAVLQHPVPPAYGEQLWPASWLATYYMHGEAEKLKEAFYMPQVPAHLLNPPLN